MARPANCAAPTLLLSGAARKLQTHLASYPPNYDDVFIEAHARIVNQGGATKTDLAVLGFWKHIRQAPWMEALLKADSDAVFKATTHALANDNTMTDSDRLPRVEGRSWFSSDWTGGRIRPLRVLEARALRGLRRPRTR